MAQRLALRYLPGTSLLHRWDARCKFLGLLMVTLTLLRTNITFLLFDSGLFLGLLLVAKLPLRRLSRDLWIWGAFLLFLLLLQAFFTPGSRLSSLPWVPASREGILLGGFACWRLGLLLGFAVFFTAVTRPRELQQALTWFLKPVPFLPGRRIGLMVSLTLRFFVLVLDQAEEVRLAHKARLGDRKKNPLRKAKSLALPLLRRSLSRAEDITWALVARGYREDIPIPATHVPPSHWIPLLVFLGIVVGLYATDTRILQFLLKFFSNVSHVSPT